MQTDVLVELTKKFIADFIELSGESPTYAINSILPEVMYPLLPKYKEAAESIYMPMSYFETNMVKEGIRERLKGWTTDLNQIVTELESGLDMDFDRFRFENLTVSNIEKDEIHITDYKTLKCEKRLETFIVKSFDIISTTNLFKGTIEIIYQNKPDRYPVKEVKLICNKLEIFNWLIYQENEESLQCNVDINNVKDINSFFYYTKNWNNIKSKI